MDNNSSARESNLKALLILFILISLGEGVYFSFKQSDLEKKLAKEVKEREKGDTRNKLFLLAKDKYVYDGTGWLLFLGINDDDTWSGEDASGRIINSPISTMGDISSKPKPVVR